MAVKVKNCNWLDYPLPTEKTANLRGAENLVTGLPKQLKVFC
jgi:hypothetical protein